MFLLIQELDYLKDFVVEVKQIRDLKKISLFGITNTSITRAEKEFIVKKSMQFGIPNTKDIIAYIDADYNTRSKILYDIESIISGG